MLYGLHEGLDSFHNWLVFFAHAGRLACKTEADVPTTSTVEKLVLSHRRVSAGDVRTKVWEIFFTCGLYSTKLSQCSFMSSLGKEYLSPVLLTEMSALLSCTTRRQGPGAHRKCKNISSCKIYVSSCNSWRGRQLFWTPAVTQCCGRLSPHQDRKPG